MPKDAHARKQIQLLKAELAKKVILINRTNSLVIRQAAVTSLLIERGIITSEQINERIETLLYTNPKNIGGMSPKSEGGGTAENNSGRGKLGLLSGESDRDDSGDIAKGCEPQNQESETSDQPLGTGSGNIGESVASSD